MHNTSRTIIISISLMFIVSSFLLSWKELRERDPDINKDWWSTYFVNPTSPNDLDFVIENHSDSETFSITLELDKEVFKQETLTIKRADRMEVPLSLDTGTTRDVRIIIKDALNDEQVLNKELH